MPKHIKTPDPDSEYVQGHIRLIRLGSAIYLYLKGHVHPMMTRKCGDVVVAKNVFFQLRHGFKASLTFKTLLKERSLLDRVRRRLRMFWWRMTG